jgi:hypothetical protein
MPTSSRHHRASALTAVIAVIALAVVGCGGPDPSADPAPNQPASNQPAPPDANERLAGSLTELFEQELQNSNLTDFEREVLQRASETGKISEPDYDEAFNRYEQCVSDLGYTDTWEKMPNGIYQITPPLLESQAASEIYFDQANECATGTTMVIEALYTLQQANPNLLADSRLVAIQCLVSSGFVDPSYTVDDFDRDFNSQFQTAPYDVMDPEANLCLFGAGYAIGID